MEQKLRYIAYCRKSTEDNREKQALSIPAQNDEIKRKFENLKIVKWLEESQSAFDVGRPKFKEMIDDLKEGRADGIVCWHPDRMSRNPIDASMIIYYLDKGFIKDLKFCSYSFTNDPEGKMFLNFTLSQSKYFSDKLSNDVKRGLEKKVRDGYPAGPAPIGYINSKTNEKGKQVVYPDQQRFGQVRKLWKLLLTGDYTVPQLHRMADEEWHLTTLKRKSSGGVPLSRAGLYAMFTRSFYYGEIVWNGIRAVGKHEPMITPEEFDLAQEILGRKGRPRPQIHKFAYTGRIVCGECGGMVTAENKKKALKDGTIKKYKLYHCSHRKKGLKCSQGSVREDYFEGMVKEQLNSITIPAKFQEWAVEYLHELNEGEVKDRSSIYKNTEKQYSEVQDQIDRLTQGLIRGLIDEEEYKRNKNDLLTRKNKLKQELDNTDRRADNWLDMCLDIFDFATYAKVRFDTGPLEEKKTIFGNLGSIFILKDKILTLVVKKPFVRIKNGLEKIKAVYPRFELEINGSYGHKSPNCAAIKSLWLPELDSNQ